MARHPWIPIVLAAVLSTPLALGSGGLLDTSAPTPDLAHDGLDPAALDTLLAGSVNSQTGVTIENDGNHTTNVAVDTDDRPLTEVGRWLGPIDGEVPAVNLAVLPDGSVLYYSGVEARSADETEDTDLTFMVGDRPMDGRSRVMTLDVAPDGTVSHTVTVPGPDETGPHGAQDLFCSGTTLAPDGTVVTTGATEWHTLDEGPPEAMLAPLKGGEQTALFDPATDTWSLGADMAVDRWYPSAIQLGDGRTLVAAGIQTLAQFQTHNTLVEVYDPGTDSYEQIEPTTRWADGVETGALFPEAPETGNPSFDEAHDRLPNLPMYPRIFTVPTGPQAGEVFYTTAGDLWGPFGEHPGQALWSRMQTFDVDTGTFTVHDASVYGARQLAPSVPQLLELDDGYAARYLTFGGTLQQSFLATNTAELADLSGPTPEASATDSMTFPRWSHNGVLLPDGQTLAVGGGLYDNVVMHGAPEVAFLNGELYDPDAGEWTLTAPMTEPRVYHSTAVLLPDGRVLAGGHVPLPAFHEHQRETVNPQVTDSTFELYEPPYLFLDDTRPEIALAPGQLPEASYGGSVFVGVTGIEEGVHSAVLMRPGATTHGFDADQRGIELEITDQAMSGDGEGTLTVQMPSDGSLAPPGYYMLFVNEDVDGQAMPSEALFLHLD